MIFKILNFLFLYIFVNYFNIIILKIFFKIFYYNVRSSKELNFD